MASHGIPRGDHRGSQNAEQVAEEQKRIIRYQDLVRQVDEKVQDGEFSEATFDLTTELLRWNPEYYTMWNHRRRTITRRFEDCRDNASGIGQIANWIMQDLQFLLPLLMKFPKCYWIWNHRFWLLEQTIAQLPPEVARPFWKEELGLVGKMLARDNRNFHGWGYRRRVVSVLESTQLRPPEEPSTMTKREFDYATRMIDTDLSNFSAWYRRSKLIPQLLDEKKASTAERKKMLDEELELILNAIYTDPFDQSIWFYHQYLMTILFPLHSRSSVVPQLWHAQKLEYLEGEIVKLLELLRVEIDSKWVYQSLIQLSMSFKTQAGRLPGEVHSVDVSEWFNRLKSLDPLRKGRWDDMQKALEM